MKLARRALLILLGYVFAALIGSLSYVLIGGLLEGMSGTWWHLQELVGLAAIIAFFVGIIAIPVTLPLIVILEYDLKYRLAACLAGGLFLGLLMAGLLSGGGFAMPARLLAIFATVCGALAYWALVFHFFAPACPEPTAVESIKRHSA